MNVSKQMAAPKASHTHTTARDLVGVSAIAHSRRRAIFSWPVVITRMVYVGSDDDKLHGFGP
jgi:hypothetical protein